jgi:hypothetical protein
MTVIFQKNGKPVTKQGIPVYTKNPSVPYKLGTGRMKRIQLGTDRQGLVIDEDTGDILGRGGATFYQWDEVDNERFVKLYLAGIKQAVGLTKSGLSVFEVIYKEVGKNSSKDTVILDAFSSGLEERTYQRGIRELLEKQFIFRSPNTGIFFVNIRFMFNGDRLAFVKGYWRNKEPEKVNQTIPEIEHQQPETSLLPEPIENPSPQPDEQGGQMNLFRE